MRGPLILAVPVVALAGCAGLPRPAASPGSVQAGSFDCAPTDAAGGRRRLVSIAPDRSAGSIDLKLPSGQQFALSPLGTGSDRLYSGPRYAWRAGGDTGVLTDIENIQTYRCRQVGNAQAAASPAGGKALP